MVDIHSKFIDFTIQVSPQILPQELDPDPKNPQVFHLSRITMRNFWCHLGRLQVMVVVGFTTCDIWLVVYTYPSEYG